MQRKREGWNVVLSGFWNRMIFTPEWVSARLFEGAEQLETAVTLLPILPIIYRDKQVAVEISNVRIVCRARDLDNEAALRRSGTVAGIVLQALPETPVNGVGLNFGFREERPASHLLDLFDVADNPNWAGIGWEIGERKIIRQFTDGGDALNLTLELNGSRLDIDFNFHTTPQDNATAIAAVAPDRIITLRDRAICALETLYGLELEGNDDV